MWSGKVWKLRVGYNFYRGRDVAWGFQHQQQNLWRKISAPHGKTPSTGQLGGKVVDLRCVIWAGIYICAWPQLRRLQFSIILSKLKGFLGTIARALHVLKNCILLCDWMVFSQTYLLWSWIITQCMGYHSLEESHTVSSLLWAASQSTLEVSRSQKRVR